MLAHWLLGCRGDEVVIYQADGVEFAGVEALEELTGEVVAAAEGRMGDHLRAVPELVCIRAVLEGIAHLASQREDFNVFAFPGLLQGEPHGVGVERATK